MDSERKGGCTNCKGKRGSDGTRQWRWIANRVGKKVSRTKREREREREREKTGLHHEAESLGARVELDAGLHQDLLSVHLQLQGGRGGQGARGGPWATGGTPSSITAILGRLQATLPKTPMSHSAF